jgi:hypothetical protein
MAGDSRQSPAGVRWSNGQSRPPETVAVSPGDLSLSGKPRLRGRDLFLVGGTSSASCYLRPIAVKQFKNQSLNNRCCRYLDTMQRLRSTENRILPTAISIIRESRRGRDGLPGAAFDRAGGLTQYRRNPIINRVLVALSIFDWPPGMEATSPPDTPSRPTPDER